MKNYRRVYATVDLDAIESNMAHMKQNIDKDTRIIAIIKADGYGHGAVPIAKHIEDQEYIFGFGVASIEEAVILRKAGITKPILILGYTFPDAYEDIVRYHIRPTVFKWDMAKQLSAVAAAMNEKVFMHIKIDTGMSRIGIMPEEESIPLIEKIAQLPNVEMEGIFTHLARADEMNKTSAREQLVKFNSFVERLKEQGLCFTYKHSANSAGILELPEANMNLVRAGITTYGLWPSNEVRRDIVTLKPALELKSHIVYIKELKPGAAISYGGTYVTKETTRVATIPVGYADGYPRSLSGRGYVLIKGEKAPILGRVCMDQFMVDVSHIPKAQEYDEVTLIGKEGDNVISVGELEDLSGRFNYELVCGLGKRIPRVYLKDSNPIFSKDYFEDYR